VPALMPMVRKASKNNGGSWFAVANNTHQRAQPESSSRADIRRLEESRLSLRRQRPVHAGHLNKRDGHSRTRHLTNQREHDSADIRGDGIKHGGDCFNDPTWAGKQGGTKQPGLSGPRTNGKGDGWFEKGAARHGSKSHARKAASAMIARIPLVLSQHIARVYKPEQKAEVA
jgi:hypothetical protein